MARGSPDAAAASICGPPGYGSPSSRATLSNASPAASSIVSPSSSTSETRSRASSSDVWPPETSSATVGQFDLGAVVAQHVGTDVPDEVIDAVERQVERHGERLRRADSHHEGSGKTRAARHRDRVEVGECHARLGERGLDRRCHRLEVGARGDLGHHSAEAGVLVHRRRDHVGEQPGAPHDADAGLVATRLDAEHERPVKRRQSRRAARLSRVDASALTRGPSLVGRSANASRAHPLRPVGNRRPG